MSQWGHDFRPEYLGLSVLAERFPDVPRLALTATADMITRAEIRQRLALGEAPEFLSSFDRPNIRYTVVEKANAREQLLGIPRRRRAEPEPDRVLGDRLLLVAQEGRPDRRVAQRAGHHRAGLPRGPGPGGASLRAGPVPARGRHRGRRHHRLRDGHRQARRPVRRPPRPAQEHRGVLPGDRSSRSRRRAGPGVDGLRPGRCRAAEVVDRRLGRPPGDPPGGGREARRPARVLRGGDLPTGRSCWTTSGSAPGPAATATPA